MERIEKLMKLVDMITSTMINAEYHDPKDIAEDINRIIKRFGTNLSDMDERHLDMALDAIISFKTRIENGESDALNSHDDKMVKETRCYRSDACHHEDRLDDTEVIFELID